MPCIDGRDREWEQAQARRNRTIETLLCAVVRAWVEHVDGGGYWDKGQSFEALIDAIDWQEAGLGPKDLREWYEEHKAHDEARRKLEAKAKRKEELRKAGLAKLTDAEKNALGIKP